MQKQEIRTLLIVEDDEGLNEMLSTWFVERGYTGVSMRTATSALAWLEKGNCAHAIISDLRMPGMDGMEFLHAIRSKGDNTPFILVTGYLDMKVARLAMQLNCMDVLEKPMSLEELAPVADKALEVGMRRRQISSLLAGLGRDHPELDKKIEKIEQLILTTTKLCTSVASL
jgi:DNA-binding NtrC family response regulator